MGIMNNFAFWGDGISGEKKTLQELYDLYMSGEYDSDMTALAIIYCNGEEIFIVDVSPDFDLDAGISDLMLFIDDIGRTAILNVSLGIRGCFTFALDDELIIEDYFDGLGTYADGWTVDAYLFKH